MHTTLERHLIDNPGHQIVVNTINHQPTTYSTGGTEWVVALNDTDGSVIVIWSGLTLDYALADLALDVRNFPTCSIG